MCEQCGGPIIQSGRGKPAIFCKECAKKRAIQRADAWNKANVRGEPKIYDKCLDCGNKPKEYSGKGQRPRYCELCSSKRKSNQYKEWATRDINRESRNKYQQTAREKHGLKWQLSKFNLTIDQFNQIIINQDNKCAICRTSEPGRGRERFCVDHDHSCCNTKGASCGQCVRGLLCGACNTMLGQMDDNIETLERAIKYLKKEK